MSGFTLNNKKKNFESTRLVAEVVIGLSSSQPTFSYFLLSYTATGTSP